MSVMATSTFLVLCFVACIIKVSGDSCADPLSCWLESLEFKIPDSCFDALGHDFCITNLVCTSIYIKDIQLILLVLELHALENGLILIWVVVLLQILLKVLFLHRCY